MADRYDVIVISPDAVDWWLTTEDLPLPENRVALNADGNVQLAYKSTNDEEAGRLHHELKRLLNHIGMRQHHVLDKDFYVHMSIPLAGCALHPHPAPHAVRGLSTGGMSA